MSVINVTCPDLVCLYVSLFLKQDAVHVGRKEPAKIYPPRSASHMPPNQGIVVFPLQVVVIAFFVRQRHAGSLLHLLLILGQKSLIDLGSGRSKSGGGDELLLDHISKLIVQDIGEFVRGRAGPGVLSRTRLGLPTSLRASHRKGFSKL